MQEESKNKEESTEVTMARFDEKLNYLISQFQSLKEGTLSDIAMLKRDKADRIEIDFAKKDFDEKQKTLQKKLDDDIEIRMRTIENKTSTYVITFRWFSVFLGGLVSLLLFHIFYN